ncbi:hypothetical protein COSO111634_36585 [Corallococcus soli]
MSAGTQLATPVVIASMTSGPSASHASASVPRMSVPSAPGCLSPITAE